MGAIAPAYRPLTQLVIDVLPRAQRDLLDALAAHGAAVRRPNGYVLDGDPDCDLGGPFTSRTVLALERAGLVEVSDDTTRVVLSAAGREGMNLHVKQPQGHAA